MEWAATAFNAVFFLFIIGFVALVILALRQHAAQKRKWRVWAMARNWTFREDWPLILDHYTEGALGRGGSAYNGFEGSFDGQSVAGFQYKYTTGSGKNRSTHRRHVSLVRIPGAQFPGLTISRENFFNRLLDDIEFENAEFNRRWFVKGEAPRFAHDVIHPRLMHRLNTGVLPNFLTLWFERDAVLLATDGTLKPEFADFHLRFLTEIIASVPRFVWDNVGRTETVKVTNEGPGISLEEQEARRQRLLEPPESDAF